MPALFNGSVELAAYKRSKEVDLLRDEKLNNGFSYQGFVFDSDETSMHNLVEAGTFALSCLMSNKTWPSNYVWITKDNTKFPILSAQEMLALSQAASQFKSSVIISASFHKTNLLALSSEVNTCEDVNNYDINLNWPTNELLNNFSSIMSTEELIVDGQNGPELLFFDETVAKIEV